MTNKTHNKFETLRMQAETLLAFRPDGDEEKYENFLELIHELKVCQTEIEIQNEELRQAQQELTALHRQYTDLYESAPCGYITLTPKGTISRINVYGTALLGADLSALTQPSLRNFITAEYTEAFHEALKRSGETGKKQVVELQINGNGEKNILWVQADVLADRDERDVVKQWRITLTDITERKQSEKLLQERETKYRTLFEAEADAIFLVDEETLDIVDANKAAENLYGYTKDKLLQLKATDLCAEEKDAEDVIHEQILTTVPLRYHIKKDGTVFPVEINANRCKLEGRNINISAIRDLTNRTSIEEKLVYHSLLFQNISDAIISADPDFIIKSWNATAEKFYGWKEEKVIGYFLNDVVHMSYPQDNEQEVVDQFLKFDFWEGETQQITKNSNSLVIYSRIKLIRDSHGNPMELLVVNRDITEQKQKKEELETQRNVYRNLIETSPDAIVQTDLEGNILLVNKEAVQKGGFYSKEELIGKNTFDYIKEKEKTKKLLETTLTQGRLQSIELTITRKDGSTYDAELSVALIKDEQGNPTGFIGIIHDITHRKRLLEKLEIEKARALEADRLKTTFLSSMSHEIRTPLNAVIGFLDIVLSNEHITNEDKQYLETAKFSSDFLLQLINDLLDFSKIEVGQLTIENIPFSLNTVLDGIHSVGTMLIENQKKTIAFRRCVPETIHDYTYGDPYRLEQVLLNLISNAVKFTDKGFVEYGIREIDAHTLEFYVRDTGCGIPEAKQQIIFEPLRQADEKITKRYGGTGLGLAITKKLIAAMNGTITFTTRLGEGTTFFFTLPYKKTAAPRKERYDNPASSVTAKTTTILVVEDNHINQLVIQKMLSQAGYTVLIAEDGRDAISLLKTEVNIGLVFMDMYMPHLDGVEATKVIRRMESAEGKERIPIIALSAAGSTTEKKAMIEAGCDGYLPKPIVKKNTL